jgi:hypothetical protein
MIEQQSWRFLFVRSTKETSPRWARYTELPSGGRTRRGWWISFAPTVKLSSLSLLSLVGRW